MSGVGRDQLAGTARLIRLALRRDRIQLPVWMIVMAFIQAVSVSSVLDLYPTQEELHAIAVASAVSPVALATNGLVSGDSAGAVLASQTVLILAITAAFMSTLLVVRHTRQEEETGRAELIGSAVVGRYAMLTAALAVALGANLVVAVLNVAVLVGYGLPLAGSVATGLAIGGAGLAFAGVAAVTAQVTDSARVANGLAAGAIGVAFVLRAVGDVASTVTDGGTRVISGWPSWLSPIGWAQQVRPYDDNAWWVLGLLALWSVATLAGSFWLTVHRDFGAGLVSARPGPAAASPRLLGPLGLAWQLQRGTFVAWAVTVALLGVAYGSIGDEIDEFVGTSDEMAELISQLGGGAANLTDAFFAAILGLMAIAVAAYAVQALLRLRAEEAAGRLEPVLATGVSRQRIALCHAGIVGIAAVVLFAVAGAATGISYGIVAGDVGNQFAILTGAALVHVPAALVLAALTVAAFGALPRFAVAVSWGALAGCLLLAQLGALLDLPQIVLDVSPFSHVPAVPVADVTVVPLISLFGVAAALLTVGVAAFRRRDVPA